MSNRPALPNLIELQNEVTKLRHDYLELKSEYDSHIVNGFLAGSFFLFFVVLLELVKFQIIK